MLTAAALRSRQYRAAKRASMGADAYKADQARKRRLRRISAHTPVVRVTPAVVNVNREETLNGNIRDTLLKKIIKAKQVVARITDRPIQDKTVELQFKRLLNLHKLLHPTNKKQFIDLKWTKDTKKVIKFIQTSGTWRAGDSQNSQLSAVASILSVLPSFKKEYLIYSKLVTSNSKDIQAKAGDIELTDYERKNLVPWSELKKLYKKCTKSSFRCTLIALLTLLPPRRNMDYQYLTLSTKNKSKDYNYLIVDKSGMPKMLVYNKYKTSKTLGTQKFRVPEKLALILKDYIKNYKIKINQPLFYNVDKNNKRSYYKNFTPVITKAFKHFTKKNTTINMLRHAKIIHFLKSKQTPTAKKTLSRYMGHSVHQQSLYDRIDV